MALTNILITYHWATIRKLIVTSMSEIYAYNILSQDLLN